MSTRIDQVIDNGYIIGDVRNGMIVDNTTDYTGLTEISISCRRIITGELLCEQNKESDFDTYKDLIIYLLRGGKAQRFDWGDGYYIMFDTEKDGFYKISSGDFPSEYQLSTSTNKDIVPFRKYIPFVYEYQIVYKENDICVLSTDFYTQEEAEDEFPDTFIEIYQPSQRKRFDVDEELDALDFLS